MSNSPLASVTLLSPNFTKGRTYKGKTYAIDTITIHCFVGQVTAKRGCEVFQNKPPVTMWWGKMAILACAWKSVTALGVAAASCPSTGSPAL